MRARKGHYNVRSRRLRSRARPSSGGLMWSTVLLGLALMPAVCGLTFVSLVAVSEAALGPGLPSVDLHGLEQLAVHLGLLPQPQPTEAAFVPLPTIDAEPAGLPAAVVTEAPPAPSDTASSTSTATGTTTAISTSTATSTATSTPTFTETTTATPTPTVSPTHTLAATQTPPRTFTPTRTPTRTQPPTPTITQTPTAAPPAETPSPTASPAATEPGAVVTETETASPTATIVPPTATSPPACSPAGNASFESTLLGLINAERQPQGLQPYNLQSQLQAAARAHSTDMACNNFLSHTGSDGSSVRDRIARQGYSWSWAGENIYATGNTSSSAPQQAFDWWMNSAPHRANLLSPNYIDIGLGYMYRADSSYGGYFTAVFARP